MTDHTADFRPLEAVVFDLDGTLVDTLPDIAAALNSLLVDEGRAALAEPLVAPMIGDGAAKLVERGFAATGAALGAVARESLARRFLALYEADVAGRSRPYPGVATTLSTLRAAGLCLAVCTNKPTAPSEALLASLGLAEFFSAVVGGDSLAVKKPDGRHLLATLARLGVVAGHAVMVGDSANDVAAARAAGVPVIVVSYGYGSTPSRALGADAVIDGFADLGPALERLAAAART